MQLRPIGRALVAEGSTSNGMNKRVTLKAATKSHQVRTGAFRMLRVEEKVGGSRASLERKERKPQRRKMLGAVPRVWSNRNHLPHLAVAGPRWRD